MSRAGTGAILSGTNLAHAGDHNQRVTLHAIRVNGPITRSKLAAMTGLTAPAIANITKRLLNEGLILEADRVHGARGQPASRLVINPDCHFSVGVNIDRDHVTVVILDFAGRVRARASQEIAFASPEAVRSFYARSVKRLLAKLGLDQKDLMGIGLALPDQLGSVTLPGIPEAYHAWSSVEFDSLFQSTEHLPLFIENDAAAAAMGELQFGAGHRHNSFFYILITAGLGGGLVIEGNYYRGAAGRSGELGWLTVPSGGREVQLQNLVSLSALNQHVRNHSLPVPEPAMLMRPEVEARSVVDGWIAQAVDHLYEPLMAVNCLINPDAILIGGRLPGEMVDQLAFGLNQRFRARAGSLPGVATVARAEMSEDAPAVGAAILPFTHHLLPTRSALMKRMAS